MYGQKNYAAADFFFLTTESLIVKAFY